MVRKGSGILSRRGENIYKRKDGRWEGRYIKDHAEGKTHYGYVYARTYKEAKEKLLTVFGIHEIPEETSLPVSRQGHKPGALLTAVATAWLDALKPQLKASSLVKYINVLNTYIFPHFADICIEEITREDVDTFCNELLTSGGKTGNGLAPKTVVTTISVLKNVFKYAAQYGKYKVADLNGVTVKQDQKPLRVLSLAEQQRLSEYLQANLSLTNLGILVSLYTGIRIGEVCALKWEDISFDEQFVYIHKTMQRLQTKNGTEEKTTVQISVPKSDCSMRRIPLPDDIFQLLVVKKCPGNTYFLTGHERSFVEPRTLQNRFKAVMNACGIKNAHFHVLRHTFATRCVELGFDIKSLSEILGHASVNITLNRYVHPSMELKKRNMDMLANLFSVK